MGKGLTKAPTHVIIVSSREGNKPGKRYAMKNSVFATLLNYRFEASRRPNTIWWGIGSLVWGDTFHVTALGGDLYEVTHHHWFYDQYGDPVVDTTEKVVLHGAEAIGFAFTHLPSALWR